MCVHVREDSSSQHYTRFHQHARTRTELSRPRPHAHEEAPPLKQTKKQTHIDIRDLRGGLAACECGGERGQALVGLQEGENSAEAQVDGLCRMVSVWVCVLATMRERGSGLLRVCVRACVRVCASFLAYVCSEGDPD